MIVGRRTRRPYLRLLLSTIPGPIVVVGYSYGGFVVTNGATGNPNVLGDHIIARPYPGAAG